MTTQRPQRGEGTGILTGVCAGLGAYTRVDPVVWRVGFAMTALAGGVGVLLYGLAWLLLPEPGGGSSLGEQLLNRRLPAATPTLAVTAGLAVTTALSLVGGFGWSTLVLATPLVLGLLVAHTRGIDMVAAFREVATALRSAEPPPAPAGPPDSGASSGAGVAGEASTVGAADPADVSGSGLSGRGATPRATRGPGGPVDLSVLAHRGQDEAPNAGAGVEPGRGSQPPSRPSSSGRPSARRGVAMLVLLLVLMAVSAGNAIVVLGVDRAGELLASETGLLVLGGLLVLLGLLLVIGTWTGGDRGLVSLGTLLVLLCVATVTVDMTQLRFGDVTWRPASVTAIEEPYELTVGTATLDLTELPLEQGEEVTVDARVAFGGVQLLVPSEARVDFHSQARLVGEVNLEDAMVRSGPRLDVRETLEPEGDSEDPPMLVIRLSSYGTDVEVRRVEA